MTIKLNINKCFECGKIWKSYVLGLVCSDCKSKMFERMDNGDPCGYLSVAEEYLDLKKKKV